MYPCALKNKTLHIYALLTAVAFIIAKTGNNPKCLSIREQIIMKWMIYSYKEGHGWISGIWYRAKKKVAKEFRQEFYLYDV